MTVTNHITASSTGTPARADCNTATVPPSVAASGSIGTFACENAASAAISPFTPVSTLVRRAVIAALSVSLFLVPSPLRARTSRLQEPGQQFVQSQRESEEAHEEREQAQREREEEKREREQEKREAEQDRLDRLQELYDDGREALDDDHYEQAVKQFAELAQMNGPQTDAALYWKAYAENRLAKKTVALATIAELKTKFPQSRWKKDAEALEIEVKQSSGSPVKVEEHGDSDLYNLALQGVMNNSPERAIPLIEKKLNGPGSVKEKGKLLFVLAQSGQPSAMAVLARIAQGQSNPELQRKAVEYLGMFGGGIEGGVEGGVEGGIKGGVRGGRSAHKILADVYASGADESVKRAVLRSYMMSGDRDNLLAAAKSEKNESLKLEAIRQLGISGGQSELQQLYQTETSTNVKREILQGLFLSGDSGRLEQLALNEKDLDLRRIAVRNLGLMGGTSPALKTIYDHDTNRSLKEEVLNAYFLSGNAKQLVAIAKAEKDPALRKAAVQKLSLMGSKEGNDFLMELLDK